MKPTKKQITEVTQVANAMNFSIERALKTLAVCSLSIFQSIGAIGVVEASMESARKSENADKGGVSLADFSIEKETEKAYLIYGHSGMVKIEKWVPKSVITSDGIIPLWALRK